MKMKLYNTMIFHSQWATYFFVLQNLLPWVFQEHFAQWGFQTDNMVHEYMLALIMTDYAV